MGHWLSTAISTYLLHPLTGRGYLLWSGIASDLGEVTLIGLAAGWWHHHNCGQKRCLRLGHPHPDHQRPVCRRHFHNDLTPPKGTT